MTPDSFLFVKRGSGMQALASGEEGSFSLAEGNPSPPQQVKLWLADAPPSAQVGRECSTKEQFIKFLVAS